MKVSYSSVLVGVLVQTIFTSGYETFELLSCKYDDLDCYVKFQQGIIDTFWNGNDELQVPILDPLRIKNVTLTQRGNGVVNFDLKFKDCDFIGYRDSKVVSVSGWPRDFDGTTAELEMRAPRFTLIGPYVIKGRLLALDIQGSGISNVTLKNVMAKMKFKLKSETRNGLEYAKVDKLKLDIHTSRTIFHFEDLFDGDKQLNEYGNLFINENWQLVFDYIKSSTLKTFEKIWQDILNHILSKLPYRSIFID
ncbi:hypothetical protein DMENIID0001_026160 [Sergentomyia squamirostris]